MNHGIRAHFGPIDGTLLPRSGTEYVGAEWRHIDEATLIVSIYEYRRGGYWFVRSFQASIPSDVPEGSCPLESLVGA